jgi:hypothetical protein
MPGMNSNQWAFADATRAFAGPRPNERQRTTRSVQMRMRHWLASVIGAAALGLLVIPAQAAPVGALTGNGPAAQEAGASEAVQVRHRCYRHRGHWHCKKHRYRGARVYGYGYGPYYGSGFYSPGINLYIGPRHRNHRRHW